MARSPVDVSVRSRAAAERVTTRPRGLVAIVIGRIAKQPLKNYKPWVKKLQGSGMKTCIEIMWNYCMYMFIIMEKIYIYTYVKYCIQYDSIIEDISKDDDDYCLYYYQIIVMHFAHLDNNNIFIS